jgi:hypothetical protein
MQYNKTDGADGYDEDGGHYIDFNRLPLEQ